MRPCTYPYALATSLLLACGPEGVASESSASTSASTTDTPATGSTTTPTSTGTDPTSTTASDGTTSDGSSSSTTSTTSTTADSTTSSTGEPTTGEPEPLVCEVVLGEHAGAACPGGPCPLVTDVELHCNDYEFAAPGIHVAPAPDTTWLVTTSNLDSMLYRVAPDGAERVTGVLDPFPRSTVLLALGPDGAPHLALDSTVPGQEASYPGGLLHLGLGGDAWTETTLHDALHYIPPIDLLVDDGGRPRVFFRSEPPDQYEVAVRDGDVWANHAITTPKANSANRFSLTAAGEEVAYAVSGDLLRARVDGQTTTLGDTLPMLFGYRPANPAPVGPDLAAALDLGSGLAVAWASLGPDPEPGSVTISGASPLPQSCPSGPPGVDPDAPMPCPGTCHDDAVGTEPEAYTFARTTDGLAWLAWLVTRRDVTYHFELEQFDDVSFFCRRVLDSDASTGELHLVRVPLGAEPPKEVLVMPVQALQGILFTDLFTPIYPVEIGSFGQDLAIALRLREPADDSTLVRVLRIDTAAFE